ncbi:epithelial-stromal interaction protein 1 [Betta splendens]|uniref:Epithelial-stromal interaction protein 1 n=1 Tax=Betta splendens TaxID=158456 RepID=A0A6P7LHR3_BETSP|nr:epithelial-stromal interaction protein 1 [Betta splendens]
MDPYQNQSEQLRSSRRPDRSAHVLGSDESPGETHRDAAAGGNPQPADRRPQHLGGFSMIPPNESRRSQMRMMAQKEEEELQRWKEVHRVTSVHEDPERLGGNGTLAEARDQQIAKLRCSKVQKKLHREEQEKRRKQEEEEKLQKMKAEQRQKAERLQERRRQQEQSRTEQLGPDRLRKNQSFLQKLESRASGALASCRAPQTPPGACAHQHEAVETEPRDKLEKSERAVELEHKRVNTAFLDKLEAEGRRSETSAPEAERLEALRPAPAAEPVPPADGSPDPAPSGSDGTEAADLEPELDWALMKLVSSFPDGDPAFLQDILGQCGGDYQQACRLLKPPLS